MKIGASVGTVGGAAPGASAALAADQIGCFGAIAGPLGNTLGTASGAILGRLTGGAGDCALGAQIGEKLDRHVFANNLCLPAIIASTYQPDPLTTFLGQCCTCAAFMPARTQRNHSHDSSSRTNGPPLH